MDAFDKRTETQIKSLIDHAAESLGHEWVQNGSGTGAADALYHMARGEGNIRGIAQALFQIGDALESISKTYARELNSKLEGEI
mgnify:FL=1